ncbi:5700_t:CDS:2 [Entrophospora sp. SA101]|nr:5700_t:CDS:2 [Entrophospora sp. SA101]
MEQKIISDSVPAVMKKNKKPKVSENVKKVKERIIHSNTLLQLYKGKEKEMEQYTTELANLKEKLSKSDSQLFVLNKENDDIQQLRRENDEFSKKIRVLEAALAAGIFHRKEVPIEKVKKLLKHNDILIRNVDNE